MSSTTTLPIQQIHHVEFWVGNAKQAAFFYRKAFGFSQLAYSGPETGNRERASYVLEQGKIRLVLSTPLKAEHPAQEFLQQHGDGVVDIAFEVNDADAAVATAVERGAEVFHAVAAHSDSLGTVRTGAVRTFGDTVHSFVDRRGYNGVFLPGYVEARIAETSAGLTMIDHIVGNVEDHRMDHWVNYYATVFGFDQFVSFDDKDISTEYSALRSKVVASPSRLIKFPINEPADGKKKSQIQEYIDVNNGPGVQHLALVTRDIVSTITTLRANGVEFLTIPPSYYDTLAERVGAITEDIAALKKLNILVDRDEHGYMLQLFTKPLEDRPTLFFEIIQRKGAQSFGKGNFKALFESIEREQERRGNL
jgi:4-hydroxyphenylpyruvate dioxygenase